MRKKVLAIVLIVLVMLGIFGLLACNQKLPNSLQYIVENGEVKIKYYEDVVGVKEVVVPDEVNGVPVTTLKDFAVSNSDNLERIVIGKNVNSIEGWALKNNQRLLEFVVHPENASFRAVDGVLYSYDLTELVAYPSGREETSFTVPEGVKIIRDKAFYKCRKLTNVNFPSSLIEIREKAFMYDEKIEALVFNAGLERIEKDAFSFCSSSKLTSVDIPSSVNYIGEYAFYNSSNIVTFNIDKYESECASWSPNWKPTNNGLKKAELTINYKK